MIRVLFVCWGNICRSPMAEFIMKKLVEDAYLKDEFYISSAATSSEELGNPVYPPARKKLNEHGISCAGKTARRIVRNDYERFDLIIGMDEENIYNMRRFFGGDPEGKIHILMEYAGENREVSDPWYTRDFEAAWRDIYEGCTALLDHLTKA